MLWIRTQNAHNLISCHDINVAGKDVTGKYFAADNYFALLGTYESKKRALAILDCIQEHINNYEWSTTHGVYHSRVYNMPEY